MVADARRAMSRLATFLGIGFEDCMLRPTFNGIDVPSDSSYGSKIGLDTTAADRRHDVDHATTRFIERATGDLYDALRHEAVRDARTHDS